MFQPSHHDLMEISRNSEVQNASDSDEDVLLLKTSRELFAAAPAEHRVITLDDEEQCRVVELSDDDMEDSLGSHGVGYVAPDVQTQSPRETPVFSGLDI